MALSTHRACPSRAWAESPPRWNFDIFLSFRGEDTRTGFVSHLYRELQYRLVLKTFKDDQELEIGASISPDLLRAIEQSHLAIVVLSPNYASSTWCLDELSKIIESMETEDKRIMPVFFNVDPSDVRHQGSSFVEAFAKHEIKFSNDPEKVERWREALRKVANLSGWDKINYKMSNMNKLDFVPLDYAGKMYLFWVTDVETHLIARDLLHTIQELCPIETTPDPQTEKDNSKALAFMKRHMDSDLQFEFINEDSAIKLWHALRERYGNVRDSILPNTEAEWKDLRFSEFDTVMQFYSEALSIRAMMRLCGKTITEDQLIEKTLNTFPACAMRSSDLFRTHVNARRITSFQQLIEAMATAERHGNELVQRRFDRLQDSYQEHRPMTRESRHRRHDPYDRNAQEGNRSRRQSHDRRRRDFEGNRVGNHGANVGHGHHFPTPPVLRTMHIAPMRLNQGRILFMVSISDMERLINGPEFAMYLRR